MTKRDITSFLPRQGQNLVIFLARFAIGLYLLFGGKQLVEFLFNRQKNG